MDAQISITTFKEILEELSSADLQVKLWLNIENDTGLISSYVELMNNLVSGDFNFVTEKIIKEENFKNDLFQLLRMLQLYEEPHSYKKWKHDAYIIADPKWKEIRDFAKQIRQKHFKLIQSLGSEGSPAGT